MGIPEKCWRGCWHRCWQKWGCWPECWHRCWQVGPFAKQRQSSLPAPVPALRPAPPFLPAPVPAPPPALFWNSHFGVLYQVAGISSLDALLRLWPTTLNLRNALSTAGNSTTSFGPLFLQWIFRRRFPPHAWTFQGCSQRKTKGQQLKGKIVSEFFTLFHTFSHFFRIFLPRLSP